MNNGLRPSFSISSGFSVEAAIGAVFLVPTGLGTMALTEFDIQWVRQLVRDRAGASLAEDQQNVIVSQLKTCASSAGFESPAVLVQHLRSSHYSRLHRQLVENLLDSSTAFFRDFPVFKFIRHKAIPKLLEHNAKDKQLRIWCAGCSTGQEVYSLAIMLKEAVPTLSEWDVKIIGSDISTALLERAESGSYSQSEVQRGLPAPLLLRNFTKDGIRWAVKDEHRAHVDFRHINLASDWEEMPIFDIVFLRNVVGTMHKDVIPEVFGKLRDHIHDESVIFLGSDEEPPGLDGLVKQTQDKASFYTVGEAVQSSSKAPTPKTSDTPPTAAAAPPQPPSPVAATAVATGGASDGPGKILAFFQLKSLQTVIDLLLKDVKPETQFFIGLRNNPSDNAGLFELVETLPDDVKK